MTESQARDILRQLFRVLKVAKGAEITCPPEVDEAKALLGDTVVKEIEDAVKNEK